MQSVSATPCHNTELEVSVVCNRKFQNIRVEVDLAATMP